MDDRIKELTRRVAELEAEKALGAACDDVLEQAVNERLPLAQTIHRMFRVLLRALGAKSAFVRTFDETLSEADFTFEGRFPSDAPTVIRTELDVAGEPFGSAAVAFDGVLEPYDRSR